MWYTVHVVGTTAVENNTPLPGTSVILYYHNDFGDTLKTTSAGEGRYAIAPYACTWKFGERLYLKDLRIMAESRRDSASYFAPPAPVACQSDTQRIALVLDRLVH